MQPTAIDSKSKHHQGERVAFIQACWHKDIVDQSRKGFVAEMIAQGYQESGLNPNLKSKVGAVGLMQIKPSTAAGNPIGIPDVQKTDRNIEAGAKYLRYMIDQYYADDPMDPVTRGLFALASYNAGPNMVRKLREQAAAEGYDPNLWFNNVEIIASQKIGRETVQYVGNIYKYYLAYKMVTDKEYQRQAARQSSANRASK